MKLAPHSWKDRPSLIESLFPVQKLSVESYKEQMAGQGKTLTALGSFWKGRKPLILNKACVLGALLPSTENPLKDLEIFEMLMGMDEEALQIRGATVSIETLLEKVPGLEVSRYFDVHPSTAELPGFSPFSLKDFPLAGKEGSKPKFPKLSWKERFDWSEKYPIYKKAMKDAGYSDKVRMASRPEEVGDRLFDSIWEKVNEHLGTSASSIPELVEEMGVARYGHRPRVADVFCGSGQIPFEAARLGCDVYASDLNPIACMLTWGAFHIVGAGEEERKKIEESQKELVEKVQKEIDALDIENDGQGWKAKAFLYCVEVICPESGWKVPLIPSLVISEPRTGIKNFVIAELVPKENEKKYDIKIKQYVNSEELEKARFGTVRGGDLVHSPDGITEYRTKISTIRGDHTDSEGNTRNNLRLWEIEDFVPREGDIFQERLYCIQWMKKKLKGKGDEYEFRSVTEEDLRREEKVIHYVKEHLPEWQEKGYVPDMKIEPGDKTDEPIRTRGWTYWHHLFNARQLLIDSFVNKMISNYNSFGLFQVLNWNSRLSRWNIGSGGGGSIQNTFYNQALNTLNSYGCRASWLALKQVLLNIN